MAEAPLTQTLDALRSADEPAFGGKSASLGQMLSGGIPVPPGFALSTAAFHAFVRESGLQRTIDDALSHMTVGDVDSVSAASRTISEAMRFAPVPAAVEEEIAARYAEVAKAAGQEEPPVAVRSSAVGEDSSEATFAGQQETYLWVRGVEHVCDAVRDCWVSLFSPPAISYRARLASAPEPAMGVTVQLMVDAAVSGVMFTCNPVSGDRSMIALNASWGLGLAVVGGEVTPDDLLVSKVTGEVVREQVHSKEVEYVPDPQGRGAVRVDVPAERRDVRCLDDAAIAALVDVARRVERFFGSAQDIEWAIARGAQPPEGVYIVQSRPVTTAPPAEKPPAPAGGDALSMVMATFGVKPAGGGQR
ncbi:MAG: PEP/pyruvate-binding domain-containing protein [Solirubrobacteraceae bacterium]|nr:PEP/pyruvate-binding domain-containing protein [Solirubrobacteraceae bacterium]